MGNSASSNEFKPSSNNIRDRTNASSYNLEDLRKKIIIEYDYLHEILMENKVSLTHLNYS